MAAIVSDSKINFVVVFKVECRIVPVGVTELGIFFIIDSGDDPRFECPYCGHAGNHIPAIDKTTNCDGTPVTHFVTVVGRVQLVDIVSSALKDPRGWTPRDWES